MEGKRKAPARATTGPRVAGAGASTQFAIASAPVFTSVFTSVFPIILGALLGGSSALMTSQPSKVTGDRL